MLRNKLLMFFSVLTCLVYPQQVKTITASYTYEVGNNVAPTEAMYETIRRAQVKAIGDAFGDVVAEESRSVMREKNGSSTNDFFSLGECDVRGEWLETIGDTIWETPKHRAQTTVYSVTLKGKIRELKTARIGYEYKFLFNGTDPERNEIRDGSFKDGDKMYLYFKAPVNGYLAVYNVDIDDDMTTQRLLPYKNQPGGIYEIRADSSYVFFSVDLAEDSVRQYVDKMVMRSRTDHDFNQFYVVFSPNPFVKANDWVIGEDLPAVIDYRSFQKWLYRNRKRDLQMCVDKLFVNIIK